MPHPSETELVAAWQAAAAAAERIQHAQHEIRKDHQSLTSDAASKVVDAAGLVGVHLSTGFAELVYEPDETEAIPALLDDKQRRHVRESRSMICSSP